VRALTFLGVAPTTPVDPPQPRRVQPAAGQLPATLTRSMFRETPVARKARLEAAAAAAREERAQKQRIRAEAEPFYARWEFWLAAIVMVLAGAAAVVGAELLTRTIADRWITLPDPSILAGVLLVLAWAGAWIGMGAAAYWDDPRRGARVFYLRGLLGGYTLWFSDWEPIGAWTAFPIATVLPWCVARGIAWPPYHYLQWSYGLIFWLVLGAYTLGALAVYLFFTLDELNF
jgi:hypothetical protein